MTSKRATPGSWMLARALASVAMRNASMPPGTTFTWTWTINISNPVVGLDGFAHRLVLADERQHPLLAQRDLLGALQDRLGLVLRDRDHALLARDDDVAGRDRD